MICYGAVEPLNELRMKTQARLGIFIISGVTYLASDGELDNIT